MNLKKQVYVILAFHAHEPLWDLPRALLESVGDIDLKLTLGEENWVARRSAEGRDIYQGLLDFARALGVRVSLEATNELLVQVAKLMPGTFSNLKAGYRDGTLYPLYGHAHHTHISLLNDAEVEDEIRLNREYLHEVMGAPEPRYAGLFPIEDSLDSAKLQGIKRSGIQFVIFPTLDRRKSDFKTSAAFDTRHEAFLIGQNLIALPRHFAVSQEIWRPITRWKVDGLKSQGYILGRYWVLPEEYRRRRFVRFPIDREKAVREYANTLRKALKAAPEGGLILYVQDLELMDFGDVALDIMQASWQLVLAEDTARVRFATPAEYLDECVMPKMAQLKQVYFQQVSWAPEIRLVLRYDGHYPPLGSGAFRGRDASREIFKAWPFIFWDPGRYMVQMVNFLFDSFAQNYRINLSAGELDEAGYRFANFAAQDQLALHSRIIKRACNWGWFPNESLQKRPFLHGYFVAELLQTILAEGQTPLAEAKLPLTCLRGLERLLEVVLDTRYGYLAQALTELAAEPGADCADAFRELERALEWREQARKSILKARVQACKLTASSDTDRAAIVALLLKEFGEYCRAVFLSLDHLQRVWVRADNVQYLLLKMYDYLFELYPPRFPAIRESLAEETELPG